MNWYQLIKYAIKILDIGPYGYWVGPDGEILEVYGTMDHSPVARKYIEDNDIQFPSGESPYVFMSEKLDFLRVVGPNPDGGLDISKRKVPLTPAQKSLVLNTFKVMKRTYPATAMVRADVYPYEFRYLPDVIQLVNS